MRKRWPVIALIVVAALVSLVLMAFLLFRSGALFRLFGRDVADAPAPTAVPLPTRPAAEKAPPPTAEPTEEEPDASATPAATDPPTEEREESAATDAPAAPTQVVAPDDAVALPPGFGISVFMDGLLDPRMMTLGPDNHVYVAERGRGRVVRLPDRNRDGVGDEVEVAADGLSAPSSVDFHPDGSLYVGETTRVLRLGDRDGDGVFDEREVIVDGLPRGGHNTRTVLLSPDGSKLYVSVGSSCNVCEEVDPRRAAIVRYDADGSDEEIFASGLRNAVGITFRPGTEELWATNNGRDWMGDDQPPETIYLVEEGDDAGWPRCHSGRIQDPDFGGPGACDGVAEPEVEMQAHSAPLGLTFYGGDQFPQEYRGDLFVAFHGSWNRSVPTGYKVVRIPMDGADAGGAQDFAAGWLRANGSQWGRPVDVLTGPDGSLFVSDDEGGAIYRIFYAGS